MLHLRGCQAPNFANDVINPRNSKLKHRKRWRTISRSSNNNPISNLWRLALQPILSRNLNVVGVNLSVNINFIQRSSKPFVKQASGVLTSHLTARTFTTYADWCVKERLKRFLMEFQRYHFYFPYDIFTLHKRRSLSNSIKYGISSVSVTPIRTLFSGSSIIVVANSIGLSVSLNGSETFVGLSPSSYLMR